MRTEIEGEVRRRLRRNEEKKKEEKRGWGGERETGEGVVVAWNVRRMRQCAERRRLGAALLPSHGGEKERRAAKDECAVLT